MTARRASVLILAALAACKNPVPAVGARLSGPSALVAFNGTSGKTAGVHPYLAIASMHGDEVRLVDQSDLLPVVGPGIAFPLSVTTASRPLLLAAAQLPDEHIQYNPANPNDSRDAATPWLLVAVSAGTRSLQIVDTWSADNRVVAEVSLDGCQTTTRQPSIDVYCGNALSPDAEIVGLLGLPPDPASGRARIVVAAVDGAGPSSGKLVLVEFARSTDPNAPKYKIVPASPFDGQDPANLTPAADHVASPGFRVADMAFEPDDLPVGADRSDPANTGTRGTRLFLASRDPIDAAGTKGLASIAVLDATNATVPPSAWQVVASDTRAPTVSVAAAYVDDRVIGKSSVDNDTIKHRQSDTGLYYDDPCSPHTFTGTRALHVYAGLDPSGCGPRKAINCGIVDLDGAVSPPALARDPAAVLRDIQPNDDAYNANIADWKGPTALQQQQPPLPPPPPVKYQPYRAPFPVGSGIPLHLAVIGPALDAFQGNGDQLRPGDPPGGTGAAPACNTTNAEPGTPGGRSLFKIWPQIGQYFTSSLMVVSSSDGRAYWIDLSRWQPPSATWTASGVLRVQVTSAALLSSTTTPTPLQLWDDFPSAFGHTNGRSTLDFHTKDDDAPVATVNPAVLPYLIEVWPGFTDTDWWSATYQGALPGMAAVPGTVARSGGTAWIALQSDDGEGAYGLDDPRRWTLTTAIGEPGSGAHINDYIELRPMTDSSATPCVLQVKTVVPPAAPPAQFGGVVFPGGALAVDDPGDTGCIAAIAIAEGVTGSVIPSLVTVRAYEKDPSDHIQLVVTNTKLGYVGRATVDVPFTLAWSEDEFGADAERAALARKARRLFYPGADAPCPPTAQGTGENGDLIGCRPGLPRLGDPLAPGPVIRFRFALPTDAVPTQDDAIVWTTGSGLAQMVSLPASGGALPGEPFAYDIGRAQWLNKNNAGQQRFDPIRVGVPFVDDQVLLFSPGRSAPDLYVK